MEAMGRRRARATRQKPRKHNACRHKQSSNYAMRIVDLFQESMKRNNVTPDEVMRYLLPEKYDK